MKFHKPIVLAFILVCFIYSPAFGQRDESSKVQTDQSEGSADTSNSQNPEKVFSQIKELISKDKWKEASKLMTQKAQDEFVVEQVISSIGLTKMNMDFPIPGLDEAIDEIEDVLAKYKFDTLKIDTSSMFKMKMSMGEDDEDEVEDDKIGGNQSAVADQSEKIIKHVNQSGKRWEIIKDLWHAKKGSPFSMSAMSGKVKKSEVENKVAYLQVSMAPAESDDSSGVVVQMVSPPAAMRMVKENGEWKLDGRDHKRTMKLMNEFMKNQPGLGAPQKRSDF